MHLKFNRTTIHPYFDGVISSHEFQQPKEALVFWQRLTESIDFSPDKTLFIDDNVTVLKTAQAFGIKHILGIHQPDSKKHRLLDAVPAIHHFDEIITGIN